MLVSFYYDQMWDWLNELDQKLTKIDFYKRNGEFRSINCRFGVGTVHGKASDQKEKDLLRSVITVWLDDNGKTGYRSISLDSIISIDDIPFTQWLIKIAIQKGEISLPPSSEK